MSVGQAADRAVQTYDRRMGFTRTRTTRLAGALSLIGLALVTLSDYLLTDFWDHNAMLTSVVAP